jgi:prophage regulatory protein
MSDAKPKLIDLETVKERTGICGPSVYRLGAKGLFPKPLKIGLRASRWVESEIDAYAAERIASRPRSGRAA